MNNAIPPMTDPLGKYWEQPDPAGILLDDMHALMTERTFLSLKDYSCSTPSGVYPGKMWRRHDGSHNQAFIRAGGKPTWLLCWYGPVVNGKCSVNTREVLLI